MFQNKIPAIFLSVLVLASCSSTTPHTGQSVTTAELQDGVTLTEADTRAILPSGKLAGDETALLKMEAVVYVIDYHTRKLGLKTSDGNGVELIVGPAVKNFNQIQAGDKVAVEYMLSVAFEVRKPTEQESKAAAEYTHVTAKNQADLGEKPSAVAAIATIRIMNVEEVDKKKAVVQLKDVNSAEIIEISAKYPENLEYIKAGDTVVITAAEAVAANVSRIP